MLGTPSVWQNLSNRSCYKYRPFCETILFFTKVASACTVTCYMLGRVYSYFPFIDNPGMIYIVPLVISICHATVYYPVGYILHYGYEANYFPQRKVIRPRTVPKQTMDWSLREVVKGEMIGLLINCCLYGAAVFQGGMEQNSKTLPNIQFISDILGTFGWYLLSIWWADLSFFTSHCLFHYSPWVYVTVHKKHHLFQYQVGWSAEVKTITESIIVSVTDLLPHLLFGNHLTYLLSWIIIGVLYNLEGHSGYTLFFINTGFHDYHHTMNRGNYGIAFYLDYIFGTSREFEDYVKLDSCKKEN